MFVRLVLTLGGGAMEFGDNAAAAKRVIAAYLRSAAERIEKTNDCSVMAVIEDADTGAAVGGISLTITGGGV